MTEGYKPSPDKETQEKVQRLPPKMKYIVLSLASPHPEDPTKRKYEVVNRAAAEEILADWINAREGKSRDVQRSQALRDVLRNRDEFISDLNGLAYLGGPKANRVKSILSALKAMYPDREFGGSHDYLSLIDQPIEGQSKIYETTDWRDAYDPTASPKFDPNRSLDAISPPDFLEHLRRVNSESATRPIGDQIPTYSPSQAPLHDIYTVVNKGTVKK